MACIDRNSSEFQDLLLQTGLNPDVLAAKIGVYQSINGLETYPNLQQLLDTLGARMNDDFNEYDGFSNQTIVEETSTQNVTKPESYSMDDSSTLETYENYAITLTNTTNKKDAKKFKGVGSLVILKQRDRTMASDKLTLLNSAIHRGRVTDLKQATEVKKSLETLIERLDDEIGKLSTMKKTVLSSIKPFIENELLYAETLANSNDYFDIQKAGEIIQYVQSLNDFADLEYHPLFYIDEITDFGAVTVSNEARALLKEWDDRAETLREKLSQQKQKQIREFMAQDPTIQMAKQQLGDEALAKMDVGVKDISIVDTYFFGASTNFLGKDHWIPSVTIRMYQEAFNRETAKFLNYKERMEKVQPEVLKQLKHMGETLKKYGIDVNSPSFELFRRYTENGKKTTTMIRKHSEKWDKYFYDITERFKERRSSIRNSTSTIDEKYRQVLQETQARNKSLQDNTEWFDPARIPEVIEFINSDEKYLEYQSYVSTDQAETKEFRDRMIQLMGEKQYNKSVEEQINKFTQFFSRREVEFDANAVAEQAQKKTPMTKGVWDRKYSPFVNPFTIDNNARTKTINNSELIFNVMIPKRNNSQGITNFYDKTFEDIIETTPAFAEFYDVAEEMLTYIYSSFDEAGRKLIQDPLFIPEQNKNLTDVLYEAVAFNEKMKNLMKWFWDWMRSKWSANPTENYSTLRINQITGEPSYRIDQSFIKNNRRKFDSIRKIEKVKFNAIFGSINKEMVEQGTNENKLKASLRRNQTVSLSRMDETLIGMINEYQGTPNWTKDQWRTKYGEQIPVSELIYKYAQHQVASETSFDLPRILNLYGAMAAENAARHEILPTAVMLKEKYDALKNTDDPAQITDELRKNATNRFGWWFEKNVLNYSHNTRSLWVKNREKLVNTEVTRVEDGTYESKKKVLLGEPQNVKTYDSFSKGLVNNIDQFLKENQSYFDEADEAAFKAIKENMSDAVSGSRVLDSFLEGIRLKALGWNLSSSLTNVFAGQLSNSLLAISGQWFPYEYIHTVTLNDLLGASMTSKFSKKMVSQSAKKANALFKKMDIKQDATNELQKSQRKSVLNSRTLEVSSPYFGITRGEDFNQIPLFVAYLRTKMVKGIDGTEMSVWDAMEAYDVADETGKVQGWNTRLKDNFRTEENIENWEELSGQEYSMFKNQMEKLIIMGHGDFSKFSGMMVKENIFGRMMMMFKTWMPMEFHKRWAAENYDYILGVQTKGRYRSHTSTTLAAQLGAIGAFTFGPLGALLGAGAGYAGGMFLTHKLPSVSASFDAQPLSKNLLDRLNESLILAQFLAKRITSFVVNPISRLTTGKRVIDVEQVYINGQWQILDEALGLNGESFTQQDLANWKSNAQEIAMTLTYMGLLILTKALTYDEDDDEESMKRKLHNATVNKLMQLAQECTQYLEPFNEHGGLKTAWQVGTFTFLENVGKTIMAATTILDDDIYLAGPNVGQNKFAVQFNRTFVPGIFGALGRRVIGDKEIGVMDIAGFTSISERQFQSTPIDNYFTPKKNADQTIKNQRIKRKEELQDEGKYTDKQIKKMVDQELPTIKQQEAKKNKGKKTKKSSEE